MERQKLWLRISLVLSALILLVSGFAFGYVYSYDENTSCMNQPLTYGIKQMNKLNDAQFSCSCYYQELKFNFNENNVGDEHDEQPIEYYQKDIERLLNNFTEVQNG